MVSKIANLFRYIVTDNQEVPRSARKRKNSSPIDDVAGDCLETPQVKRVRFSQTEVVVSQSEAGAARTPITRIASWVKMKANTFSSSYFFRPISNGTERQVDQRSEGHQVQLDGKHPRRRFQHNSVKMTSGNGEEVTSHIHLERSGTQRLQPQDEFAHPNLPSPREFARRPLHSHRHSERPSTSQKESRHQNEVLGASPNLPVAKNRVENWHRSHILRPENGSQSRKPKTSSSFNTVHERLFPVVKMTPGPCPYSMASSRQSTLQECVRLDERQQYEQLIQQFTPRRKPSPPPISVLDRNSLLMDRSALNRTTEVKVAAPQQRRASGPRSISPICVDLTKSRSPSSSRSETPVKHQSISFDNSSKINAFKEGIGSSHLVGLSWVNEMKERFESSVRISRRKAEEQSAELKRLQEKKEIEKQKAEEKARELIKEQEITLRDVSELLEEDYKVVVEKAIPELTPEMEDEVDNALYPHPPNEELVKAFKIQLTRLDIQTLKGLNWLNDEIINFYFSMLAERSNKEDNLPKVHTFNTFFYPKLVKEGYNSLRRWTKRVDVFTKDILLVPVHLGVHWCLAIIDFRKKLIEYYDSMGGDNEVCLNALRDYLVSEHLDKKKSTYDVSSWDLVHAKDIPRQLNGSDCGVFACKYAEYITRDVPVTFTQQDMPFFRRQMVWELLHQTLL